MPLTIADKTAADIMTRNVLLVQDNWSVDQLASFLVDNLISGAPVVDSDGNLAGVVSATDLVRNESSAGGAGDELGGAYFQRFYGETFTKEEMVDLLEKRSSSHTVKEIMTPMVFDVAANTPIQEVAQAMVRGRIHRVVVTDGGAVAGIITALDVLKLLADA